MGESPEGDRIMKPKYCLAKISAGYVGQEYDLGQMDCFLLVYKYLQERGFCKQVKFKGWTLENYANRFVSDPEKAKEIMIEYVGIQLPSIHINRSVPGDILLLQLKKSNTAPFLAIDGGNANFICATEDQGVTVLPMNFYTTLRAWTCQHQQ